MLHAELVRRTLGTAAGVRPDRLELWCDPHPDYSFFHACAAEFSATLHQQTGRDLGMRMDYAFRAALKPDACAIIVGSDCPALTGAYIDAAFRELQSGRQAVLGPAEDGGYVLIGLTAVASSLFEDIAWGSGQVLSQTRLRLVQAGMSWAELQTLWDLDRPQDFARYRATLQPDSGTSA